MMPRPEPTRTYYSGPLRMFCTQPFPGSVPYSGGSLKGFAGLFICTGCRGEVPRVLWSMAMGDWICRDCDTAAKREAARCTYRA